MITIFDHAESTTLLVGRSAVFAVHHANTCAEDFVMDSDWVVTFHGWQRCFTATSSSLI